MNKLVVSLPQVLSDLDGGCISLTPSSRALNHGLSAAKYINIVDPYAPDHFTYAAGQHVCPGVHIAAWSLFTTIAGTLWELGIQKKKGYTRTI
ncbi:hypothetical protein N7489_000133 [Penicillium chrysogenum]|uniref:uncharacterized protein n=1 Tax=Penicillium chrysogenum TaxID=5076 RepID=UPI0023A51B1C|nr:uncharacterized protein N7489_000133 [Penicillium chrysogenum]KAJ5249723.1 hypothetical protein N7489_000133 [Penicillium chrysogenum]KAJ5265313.1 hypothetical protein N7524_006331 [Penicillium chrysogenum]